LFCVIIVKAYCSCVGVALSDLDPHEAFADDDFLAQQAFLASAVFLQQPFLSADLEHFLFFFLLHFAASLQSFSHLSSHLCLLPHFMEYNADAIFVGVDTADVPEPIKANKANNNNPFFIFLSN